MKRTGNILLSTSSGLHGIVMRCIMCVSIFLFLVSCVEEIVMDPKEERLINVECLLEGGPSQTLHLNYSSYVSDHSQQPILNADVMVREYIAKHEYETVDGETIDRVRYIANKDYRFVKADGDAWSAEFTPVIEGKYELTILVREEDTTKRITSTTYYMLDTSMFRWYEDLEHLFPQGNPVTKDLPLVTIPYTTLLNTPEYSFNDVHKAEFPLFHFFSESTFPLWIYGMDYDPSSDEYIQAELITIPYPDSLRVLSTVHPYYDWIDRFNVLDVDRNEVAEFQRPSNPGIEFPRVLEYGYPQYLHGEYNGATTDMHYRYLRLQCSKDMPKYSERFDDEDIVDGFFPCEFCGHIYVAASFRQYRYGIPHPKAYLVFQVANEDYDRYLKTLVSWSQKKEYGGNTSLTDIWEYKSQLYSNINNGLGIFGAKYVKKVPYMDYKSITYKGTTYYKKYTLE